MPTYNEWNILINFVEFAFPDAKYAQRLWCSEFLHPCGPAVPEEITPVVSQLFLAAMIPGARSVSRVAAQEFGVRRSTI